MSWITIALLCAIAVAVVVGLTVYTYGLFGQRIPKPTMLALALGDTTDLDRLVAADVAGHADSTGLTLIEDNVEAFALRAASARQAGRSLDLQYYYWKGDLTGQLLAREVLAAADRGVRVRVLIDDFSVRGNDRDLLALNSHPNIYVRLFNPSRNRENAFHRGLELIFRLFTANRRMHNKSWIADGRLAIVGGRNIGDAYFNASAGANFRDLDLLVVGRAVDQASDIFDRFWNSSASIPVHALWRTRRRARRKDLQRVRQTWDALRAAEGGQIVDRHAADARTLERALTEEGGQHWTEQADIRSDPPEKAAAARANQWMKSIIGPMIAGAHSELKIISPYFIPGRAGLELLAGRVAAGCSVAVLTNSLAATDVAAVHGAYAPYRLPLLRAGVKLYELYPEGQKARMSLFGSSSASLHTKAFLVDEAKGYVGSFNFDPRSATINTEMGVFFECRALADDIRAVFDEEVSGKASYNLDLDAGRLIWTDRRYDPPRRHRKEPLVTWSRWAVATLVGWLPFESQL